MSKVLSSHKLTKNTNSMKRLQVLWASNSVIGKWEQELVMIGGVDHLGAIWTLPIEEAIQGILAGTWEFYLIEDFLEIPIKANTYRGSETYLAARGKGYVLNLLEELPECDFLYQHTSPLPSTF